VSAPEPPARPEAAPGLQLGRCATDIVELAALRGRARELESLAGQRGLALPRLGRAMGSTDQLTLCVRPARWLLLARCASPGATASAWQAACAGFGTAVDLSCGLTALHLAGPSAREVLVRGCRLDLDPRAFPVGAAAATLIAQVSGILASLSSGLLLLTPSSTARHLREWLAATARPFGFAPRSDRSMAALCGDQRT
jgi:heterotetrameric sarcosine oxidase gamma subunit